ncbi:MAG: twin transmembrane helix small protein [Steroidobacteraceae bacterium]|nr:twin transmembrane helix small protein [Steroidobacteraceae bacterium]
MPFKILVIVVLGLILASLGRALFHLSRRKPEDGDKMVKALAWRVGLSVSLFLLLILAYYLGWIHPPSG